MNVKLIYGGAHAVDIALAIDISIANYSLVEEDVHKQFAVQRKEPNKVGNALAKASVEVET